MNEVQSEQLDIDAFLPESELPQWGVADLPEPKPLGLKGLVGFIGPGIVMCGIQIGGGEWLLGPEITAKYGGSLMWIATIAIIGQMFYNMECGRYALYTGEPIFTGFMRNKPGAPFWIGCFVLLSIGAFIPALSTTASAVVIALFIGEVPNSTDYHVLMIVLSYAFLALVTLPILVGGKVYNTLEKIMTAKVAIVLGFCLIVGLCFVSKANWGRVFGGFLEFGMVPVEAPEDVNGNGILDPDESDFDQDGNLDVIEPQFSIQQLFEYKSDTTGQVPIPQALQDAGISPADIFSTGGREVSVQDASNNTLAIGVASEVVLRIGDSPARAYPLILSKRSQDYSFVDIDGDKKRDGHNVSNIFTAPDVTFPIMTLAGISVIGAFAGYAGGGGLSNSTYSNFVRDKGWGMGSTVGAIPSAVGGRHVTLSHIGKVFPLTAENLRRWKEWWKYILTDQCLVWGPGCVMGMALPGLLSLEFAEYSEFYTDPAGLGWAQALITADGMRNASEVLGPNWPNILWIMTCLVGLVVLLPSQMSILDDVCRRWTDVIWSGISSVREKMKSDEVGKIYYRIMAMYVTWQFIICTFFLIFADARSMVIVVANANNIALGTTAVLILYTNHRYLPKALRPRWYNIAGVSLCAFFYLALAGLVIANTPETLIYFLFYLLWFVIWAIYIRKRANDVAELASQTPSND